MYDVEGIKVCNTVFDVSNCHTVVMSNAELKSSFRMWIDVKVTPPDESWVPLFKSFINEKYENVEKIEFLHPC